MQYYEYYDPLESSVKIDVPLVDKCICSLKHRKAAGNDATEAEHLTYWPMPSKSCSVIYALECRIKV